MKLVNFILKCIWTYLFQMCFWHWNLWILKMCLQQKSFIFVLIKKWMHYIYKKKDQEIVKSNYIQNTIVN
jgi:hypothetical protein